MDWADIAQIRSGEGARQHWGSSPKMEIHTFHSAGSHEMKEDLREEGHGGDLLTVEEDPAVNQRHLSEGGGLRFRVVE